MTKTNHLGQQTTDSGHVIKESERIEAAINAKIASGIPVWRAKYKITGVNAPNLKHIIDVLSKDIAAYIMDYAHTDWSKNVRHGVQLGRKDAVRMLESLQYNTYYTATNKTGVAVQAVPLDELQKIITALTTEARVAALRSASRKDGKDV